VGTDFRLSKGGKLGSSVYFWGEPNYLTELAFGWAKFYRDKNGDSLEPITSIFVELNLQDHEIFKIDKEFRLMVAEMLEDMEVPNPNSIGVIARTYDKIMRMEEEKNGVPYKCIEGDVSMAPKSYFEKKFPYALIGQAKCYAVRDIQVINITNKIDIV